MAKETLSILLPALDEEETIGAVIDRIPVAELETAGYDVGVVVVDGNSRDLTCKIAAEKGAKILAQTGKGKGNALQTAFDDFNGDYLFMLDADNTYDPKQIPMLIARMKEKDLDVVMGSRLSGSIQSGAMTSVNFLGNVSITSTANLLFPNGHKATDICTGMWGFKGDVVKNLGIKADSFDIEAEMYAKCVKSGYHIEEVPILYYRRPNRTKLSSFKDGAQIMFRLVQERINH